MPKKALETYRTLSVLYAGTFAFMAGFFPFILIAKGMDAGAIALYFAIYSFAALLLEVPTGAFADSYGRRNAILLGFFLQCIFLPAFILLPGGIMFTLFALVVAAADSLMSGSAEAYAVDILNERGRMDYTHRLLSSGRTWKSAVFLGGSLIGGLAGTVSILLPAALCIPFALGGLAYAWLWLKDDMPKKDFGSIEKGMLRKAAESLRESVRSPSVGSAYLISLLLGLGTFGLFIYWQMVLNQMAGWGPELMGLFFSAVSLAVIAGSKASSMLRPDWKSVLFIMLALSALLGLSAWTAIPLALAGFILAWEALYGTYQPIEATIINQNTKSAIRATVLSVNALSFRVGWVLLGTLVALFPPTGLRQLWYVGAVFFFLAAALAAYAMLKKLPAGAENARAS